MVKNRDLDSAFKSLDESLRFRKDDLLLFSVKDYHFPIEFYQVGALFICDNVIGANPVFYIRARFHHPNIPQLIEPLRGFIFYLFDKIEKMARNSNLGQFSLLFDLTDVSYKNLDLSFLYFLIQVGRIHFPLSFKQILIFNLPFILSSLSKVILNSFPKEVHSFLKFINSKEIFQLIPKENVPSYIKGGIARVSYHAYPKGSKRIIDLLPFYGYSNEIYESLYPIVKKDLEFSQKEIQFCQENQFDLNPPEGFFHEPINDQEEDWLVSEGAPPPLPSKRGKKSLFTLKPSLIYE